MERLVLPDEVAAVLRIAPRTLYDRRWRRRVGLRAVKIGHVLRFSSSEIMRFVERHGETVTEGSRER